MNQYRTVRCDMWRKDDWFADLAIDAKLVWVYTFTNDNASPAGIYRIALRTIANDTGIPLARVQEIIAEFQQAKKLFYENGVIWPVTMRRHQIGNLNPKDNLAKRVALDLADLPDSDIVDRYKQYYSQSVAPAQPLDRELEDGDNSLPVNRIQDTGYKIQERDTGDALQDSETELRAQPPLDGALAVPDASAPPAKPRRKPKIEPPPPDPNLQHPAVIAYREKFHLTLNKDQRAAVASAVTDLQKWQAALDYWSLEDWRKNNIPGMLDVYANGPNSKRNGNGSPANTAPPALEVSVPKKEYKPTWMGKPTPFDNLEHKEV